MLRDMWMKRKRACLDICGAIRSNLARKREGKDRPEKEMVETQEKQKNYQTVVEKILMVESLGTYNSGEKGEKHAGQWCTVCCSTAHLYKTL